MEHKEETTTSFNGILKNLSHTFFNYVSDLLRLANLEARLAKRSFLQICMLTLLAVILLMSTWMGIFIFIVASFVAWGFSWLAALGATIGINLLLLALIGLSIFRLKRNLYFSATRKQLSFKLKDK